MKRIILSNSTEKDHALDNIEIEENILDSSSNSKPFKQTFCLKHIKSKTDMSKICPGRGSRRSHWILILLCVASCYMIYYHRKNKVIPLDSIDVSVLERELEEMGASVKVLKYKSPTENKIGDSEHKIIRHVTRHQEKVTMKYNQIWARADSNIQQRELFPDSENVDDVLNALATARIVAVDVLDIGYYESGTSEKWILTLEGGQKAMMKIIWETKGSQKENGLCNFGYEIPSSEIAAFHLNRVLGFRNTPYVVGRRVDLRKEILPVASPVVSKQIITHSQENHTCVVGKCFYCKDPTTLCPPNGIVEASIAYYIPRKLKLYTYPPKFMPFSTPNMNIWKKSGFNNKTYCNEVQKDHPYELSWYYKDLFDFCVADSIMYHYDTKHYVIYDDSSAHGLTIRLDHGRAFCSHDKDESHVFMAPIHQCCTLRRKTYETLVSLKGGQLTRKLKQYLEKDPISPVLEDVWFPVLERRLKSILVLIDRCAEANGGLKNVLVDS